MAALSLGTLSARKAPEKVTSVEGITEYRLDNGLQVLLFPDFAISLNRARKRSLSEKAYF